MKISIEPCHIEKDPRNQVTSSNIFRKNQRKVSSQYKYDPDGLFSRRIFGKFNSCDCGERKEPGICKLCDTRVISPNDVPNFYIDLGTLVPKLHCNYGKYKDVKDLLEFESFLYVNEDESYEIIKDDGSFSFDTDKYDMSGILIGIDAAKYVHEDIDEWAEKYMTDFISVPHTTQRPNIKLANGTISFSQINKSLREILLNIERINQYKTCIDFNVCEADYYLLSYYNEIYKQYKISMQEIFKIFSEGKNSFIGSNIKAHRVTGAIKGTVINRCDIDEDIILIGDTFIQTLYPYLYKKYDGDLEKINDHFIDYNEIVLVNRPPTICHLSIATMKPRVASCYEVGTFSDKAIGKHCMSDKVDDDIDILGLRTVAINPIVTDGFAGDYDGDVYLVIALYSNKAKKEAMTMLPSLNYMNYPNGNIRNVIPEDIEFANIHENEHIDPFTMSREEYIAEYERQSKVVTFNEKLPFAHDILDFALNDNVSENLGRIFDFFDNRESFKNQLGFKNMFINEESSNKFVSSVIAANITDISQSGSLYKMLQASGDSYRIKGINCKSEGREIILPINEETFNYEVKNCFIRFNDENELNEFNQYKDFLKASEGKMSIFVRSPMTCKYIKNEGCCSICAGKIPENTQNIGAFSTLMITEFATQAALSSMNKGKKDNVNKILATSGAGIKTLDEFNDWAEKLLDILKGPNVQRRFYELALLGRLAINDDNSVSVASLSNAKSDNYFGNFIYRPKEKAFKKMIEVGSFNDTSLKTQIAFNQYIRTNY